MAVLLLVGILEACLLGAYIFELSPRYIKVPVSLPVDDYGTHDWWHRIYSVIPDIGSRYYLTRLEGILVHHKQPKEETQAEIANHFDRRLSELGWGRHPGNHPCEILLPEAYLLPYVESLRKPGWTAYRKQDFDPPLGSSAGDLICLALWQTSPGVFRVVLVAARPSRLTVFLDEIQ